MGRCQVILNNIIMSRFKLLNIGLSTLLGLVSSHYYVDETGSQLYYPGALTYQPVHYRQHASSAYATQPVHSTYQPVHSTYQPVDSTYQPVSSTYQPVDSIYQPVDSTYQPVDSTYQPVDSTYQPVHSTYQPVHSTYRPVHSTYQPIPSYHEKDYIPHKADAGRSGRLFPYPIPLKKPGKDIFQIFPFFFI